MAVVAELLDKARAVRSIPSDKALGERLNRSRAIVSQWRKGTKHPEDETICALAALARVDPAPYLLAVQAERSHGVAEAAWQAIARRFAAAAVLAVAAVMPLLPIM